MASVDDEALQKTGGEVAAVLVHLTRLLRLRNQLCSPLLRLPTETIIRILSFIMAGLDSYFYSPVWTSIYSTCHVIHEIMRSATELWWRVDCTRARVAHFTFVRSRGNPQVIVSGSRSDGLRGDKILDNWRDKQEFRGHRLHTLEFYGSPSRFTHFSWILERPLPRLERLKINITESIDEDEIEISISNPVALQLPIDMPLQVLDLRNVTLPWSSHRFTGLRELHLNFRDCETIVTIPEHELFGIFDASPQLERLSLVQVGQKVPVKDGEPPKRILQFPNLTFLKLDNSPEVVKYTLAYMDLPVVASLEIRSYLPLDMAQSLNSLFPDDRLPTRLFPNPPIFAVRSAGNEAEDVSIEIDIGSIKLRFDFPWGDGEFGRNVVMSCTPRLVPPSVTTLQLDYTQFDERGWREFFMSHPEVRSIECTEFCGIPVSRSLWDALSLAEGEDTGVPCPRLESIFITSYTDQVSFTPLSDCLRNRQTAGFKLRHLKILDYHRLMTHRHSEEFRPLVEVVEANEPGRSRQRVSPVSKAEPLLTDLQWGNRLLLDLDLDQPSI